MDPVKRNATYDDLVDLSENVVGEIVGGDLFASPRPRIGHARLGLVLGRQADLGAGTARPGDPGWWILAEPELHLGPDVVVPDLAGWRRDRLPALPLEAAWLDLPPDWVCEILSPSTAAHDRARKLPVYAAHHVGHAWLIDRDARTLEVYRLESGGWTLAAVHAEAGRVRPEPFAAVEFDLAEWWPAP